MKCPKRNTNLLYGMSKATYQLLYSEVAVITRVVLPSLEKNSILIFLVFFFKALNGGTFHCNNSMCKVIICMNYFPYGILEK